jgi:hypothetical protein
MSVGLTPVGAVVRGLVAGAVGTAAMDALLFARYRRGGGTTRFADWEVSAGLKAWEDAPAPAQVGKRLVEGLFEVELPPQRVPLVNNLTHWGFGILSGAGYGLIAGSLPHHASATGSGSAPASGRAGTSSCRWRSSTSRSGSTTPRRWPTT